MTTYTVEVEYERDWPYRYNVEVRTVDGGRYVGGHISVTKRGARRAAQRIIRREQTRHVVETTEVVA